MELNEIKKELYKQKPPALFIRASGVSLTFITSILNNEERKQLYFIIPIIDIGDAILEHPMPAQHLIRWLVIPETK